MGLDCSVARILSLKRETEEPKLNEYGDPEGYVEVYPAPEYEERLDDLSPGGFFEGEYVSDFRAGPYSSYNTFRNLLALEVLGHSDEYVWAHMGDLRGQPLVELICFSDCEGWIGPKTCKKIAKDLEENADKFRKYLQKNSDPFLEQRFMEMFDRFMSGFQLAARLDFGAVHFH